MITGTGIAIGVVIGVVSVLALILVGSFIDTVYDNRERINKLETKKGRKK